MQNILVNNIGSTIFMSALKTNYVLGATTATDKGKFRSSARILFSQDVSFGIMLTAENGKESLFEERALVTGATTRSLVLETQIDKDVFYHFPYAPKSREMTMTVEWLYLSEQNAEHRYLIKATYAEGEKREEIITRKYSIVLPSRIALQAHTIVQVPRPSHMTFGPELTIGTEKQKFIRLHGQTMYYLEEV